MKQRHIFVKYCVRYLSAFMVILLCCMLLAVVALGSIEDYIMNENYLHLTDSGNVIFQEIQTMDLISQVLRHNNAFRVLSGTNGRIQAEKYMNLKYATTQLTNTEALCSFFDYCFALFRNSDLYISSVQCSDSFTKFYGRLFFAEDQSVHTSSAFKQKLFDSIASGRAFWRVDSLRFHTANEQLNTLENAILYTTYDRTAIGGYSSYVLVFAISAESLQKQILTRNAFQDGKVQIIDTLGGSILVDSAGEGLQFMDNQKDYRYIQHAIPELGWTVRVGVPEQIISNQSRSIRLMIISYVCVGIVAVVLLTFALSYRQYRNVQRLFGRIPDAAKQGEPIRNEYEALCRHISAMSNDKETYKSQMQLVERQNQVMTLEKLITRGIHSAEEYQFVENCFAAGVPHYCAVMLWVDADDDEQAQLSIVLITECLRESLSGDFINVPSGIGNELFLFALPQEPGEELERLRRVLEGITFALVEDMGVTFNVGISAAHDDLYDLSDAYQQAKRSVQAFRQEYRNTVNVYKEDMNFLGDPYVSLSFLEKLQNYLLSAEYEAIRAQFSALTAHYRANVVAYEMHKQEIFYSIYNVIFAARMQLSDTWSDPMRPLFREEYSPGDLADTLLQCAEDVCRFVESKKRSRNHELKEQILAYIAKEYVDPSLTAQMVCRVHGISEKYLFNFIKEQTGETFSALLERTRIEAAVDALLNTTQSNEKIAYATGFNSLNTFYRAFNKRMGVSPGTYRSSYTKLQQKIE